MACIHKVFKKHSLNNLVLNSPKETHDKVSHNSYAHYLHTLFDLKRKKKSENIFTNKYFILTKMMMMEIIK